MSLFVKPTPAPAVKTKNTKTIALFFAVILVVMAVTQLYTFEESLLLFASYNLPLNEMMTAAVLPILIVFEVFALPFLLRMSVSPAFRFLSMLFGWFVGLKWLFISSWVVAFAQPVESIGFIGAIDGVSLVPGWWAVLYSIGLCILAAWASWGMWPITRRRQ